MITAEYGVVKWDKKDRIFYYSIPDHLASKRGFHKCPNCTTEESEIEELK